MNYYEIALTISIVGLLITVYYLQKQINSLWNIIKQQNDVNGVIHNWNKHLTDAMESSMKYCTALESSMDKQYAELYKMIRETNEDLLEVYNKANK